MTSPQYHPAEPDIDEFHGEVDRFERFLWDDVNEAKRCLLDNTSQFARRTYCRCFFALVEGVIGWMRRHTLTFYEGVLGQGEIQELKNRAGILEKAFNALDLYTNVAGADTPLDKLSKEWIVLKKAIDIRNRITHPSFAEELLISDQDLRTIEEAEQTFFDLIQECFIRSSRAHFKQLAILERAWKKYHPESIKADNLQLELFNREELNSSHNC